MEICSHYLINEYYLDNKNQLPREEDQYIQMYKNDKYCLNSFRAVLTEDEKKEQHKEHNKKYHDENAEQIKETKKKYYEEHAEQIKESTKNYYEDNKEQISGKKSKNNLELWIGL